MIIKLDLPSPSEKIMQAIHRIANSAPLELELKAIHDRMQDYTRNSVSRKFVEDDEELNNLAQLEFGHLFEEKFKPAAGIIKNLSDSQVACWPPHADRVRIFALNFYVQEGGKNVTTVMYNSHGDYQVGLGTGRIFKYEDLSVDTLYQLEVKKWYALSVRQAHSVENIETTRLIFTLSLFDITYDQFLIKYKYLIDE